jgi:hypothetical protein
MKKESEICPHCHRPMNVYTFRLRKSLAQALLKIANFVQPGQRFNSKALLDGGVISGSDYTNMSHLKYLGLVRKADHESRSWELTEQAVLLISGGYGPAWVKVYDNRVIERDEILITLKDAGGYYQPPIQWAQEAQRLHAKTEKQPELFKINNSLDKANTL